MKTPAEHEETIRAYARGDVETLECRRPLWTSVVEVHTERTPEDPPEAFEIAREAIGDATACGVYFAEFDRVVAEIPNAAANAELDAAARARDAREDVTINVIADDGGGVRVRKARVIGVDRSMLPISVAAEDADRGVRNAWVLQWIPRVQATPSERRDQLTRIADAMDEMAPRADDGTPCAVVAFDAYTTTLEAQIGLVVASLTQLGRQPARPVIESAREAAAELAYRTAALSGLGLGGTAELHEAINAFADAMAVLHRSGVQ